MRWQPLLLFHPNKVATSGHGTFETFRDVRSMAAFETKADIEIGAIATRLANITRRGSYQ
jgi:hypothetical protein